MTQKKISMLKFFLCIFVALINFEVFGQYTSQEVISKALRFQIQADSLRRMVEIQTESLPSVPQSGRISVMLSISDNDTRSVEFQKQADQLFAQIEKLVYFDAAGTEPAKVSIVERQFAILYQSPYTSANPIPLDKPLPDGVVYKIQLGAFVQPLPANTFRGLTPVSGERLENGIIKYYAGLFGLYSDADDALLKVRQYGYKDAFIVAFFNRQSISPERAKQLE